MNIERVAQLIFLIIFLSILTATSFAQEYTYDQLTCREFDQTSTSETKWFRQPACGSCPSGYALTCKTSCIFFCIIKTTTTTCTFEDISTTECLANPSCGSYEEIGRVSCCFDNDGDGYAAKACGGSDCDDTPGIGALINPGAAEVCSDGLDNDCDGLTDSSDPECIVCTDADGDNFSPEGSVCGPIDCDDSNPATYPGATERCDSLDNDCDNYVDEDTACPTCSSGEILMRCICDGTLYNSGQGYCCEDVWQPTACQICYDEDDDGYYSQDDCGTEVDCDDSDATVHPTAEEICDDDIDQDCDGFDCVSELEPPEMGDIPADQGDYLASVEFDLDADGPIEIILVEGWNFVAFPFADATAEGLLLYNASNIYAVIPDADLLGFVSISKWNSATGTWESYDCTFGSCFGDDFSLNPGDGILIGLNGGARTISITGNPATEDFDFVVGYNLVGGDADYAYASEWVTALITAGIDVSEISKWDISSGTWVTYDSDFPYADFLISETTSYVFKVNAVPPPKPEEQQVFADSFQNNWAKKPPVPLGWWSTTTTIISDPLAQEGSKSLEITFDAEGYCGSGLYQSEEQNTTPAPFDPYNKTLVFYARSPQNLSSFTMTTITENGLLDDWHYIFNFMENDFQRETAGDWTKFTFNMDKFGQDIIGFGFRATGVKTLYVDNVRILGAEGSTQCTPGATQSCGDNTGACEFGTQTCSSQGNWGACVGGVGPATEVCDTLDNDCDGQTNEGLSRSYGNPNDPDFCTLGSEVCNVQGQWVADTNPLYCPGQECCSNYYCADICQADLTPSFNYGLVLYKYAGPGYNEFWDYEWLGDHLETGLIGGDGPSSGKFKGIATQNPNSGVILYTPAVHRISTHEANFGGRSCPNISCMDAGSCSHLECGADLGCDLDNLRVDGDYEHVWNYFDEFLNLPENADLKAQNNGEGCFLHYTEPTRSYSWWNDGYNCQWVLDWDASEVCNETNQDDGWKCPESSRVRGMIWRDLSYMYDLSSDCAQRFVPWVVGEKEYEHRLNNLFGESTYALGGLFLDEIGSPLSDYYYIPKEKSGGAILELGNMRALADQTYLTNNYYYPNLTEIVRDTTSTFHSAWGSDKLVFMNVGNYITIGIHQDHVKDLIRAADGGWQEDVWFTHYGPSNLMTLAENSRQLNSEGKRLNYEISTGNGFDIAYAQFIAYLIAQHGEDGTAFVDTTYYVQYEEDSWWDMLAYDFGQPVGEPVRTGNIVTRDYLRADGQEAIVAYTFGNSLSLNGNYCLLNTDGTFTAVSGSYNGLGVLIKSDNCGQPACPDSDNDGYHAASCGGTDCNDNNPDVNPAENENCSNGIDDDCDGDTDAADSECQQQCVDNDNDGYGVNGASDCTYPGQVDCVDTDYWVNPGRSEICQDGKDNDCSGGDASCSTCSQGQISSRCSCGGTAYESGYCCSGSYQTTPCVASCTVGQQVTQECLCSGATCNVGNYCCSSGCQSGQCSASQYKDVIETMPNPSGDIVVIFGGRSVSQDLISNLPANATQLNNEYGMNISGASYASGRYASTYCPSGDTVEYTYQGRKYIIVRCRIGDFASESVGIFGNIVSHMSSVESTIGQDVDAVMFKWCPCDATNSNFNLTTIKNITINNSGSIVDLANNYTADFGLILWSAVPHYRNQWPTQSENPNFPITYTQAFNQAEIDAANNNSQYPELGYFDMYSRTAGADGYMIDSYHSYSCHINQAGDKPATKGLIEFLHQTFS